MNALHDFGNRIKAITARGEAAVGCFLVSASSYMAEVIANHRIDFMIIDMEASHASKEDVLHILQALTAYDVTAIVRVPFHEKHNIESSLDFGARGIMIPKVETADEAGTMANACYFPPRGTRGVNCIRATSYYSRAREYFEAANDSILSVVQVESCKGIDSVHDIACVPNVDVVFIGLGDLAAALGQNGVVTGRLMDDARKRVVDSCRQCGKIAGIFAHSVEAANQYIGEGFQFVAMGNEIKYVTLGLTYCLSKVIRRKRTDPVSVAAGVVDRV